jgi:tetratricopeptide (TPR) repeat protein
MQTINSTLRARHVRTLRQVLQTVVVGVLPALAQQQPDWLQHVREQVAAQQWSAALEIADRRLAAVPTDLEARGWRARLLVWSGHLPEAEAEYRSVLAAAPEDTDILSGLAQVLARQQRTEEALTLLARAQRLAPLRPDFLIRRAHLLRALGRRDEARQELRAALALDPQNPEAKAGLASLAGEFRNEFRIGTDMDFFNYTSRAQAQTASLRSKWSARWTTLFAGDFYQRFGQRAGKFTGSAAYRLGASDALTAGGAIGRDQGIIPKSEVFFEYGHGFRLAEPGERSFFRGLETAYQQHWFWFADARILALTGSVLLYLPREWTWSLAVTAARSRFPAAGAEWRPSGVTRLGIPVHRQVTATLFFGVGTENFARVDQIGRFSARTFGGGLRYQLTRRQDITGYVAYQNRSQARTQTSFGLSYGLHF